MKGKTMLKKFGLLVALIASLTGCGKENKTANAESSKSSSAPLVGCYQAKTDIKDGDYWKIEVVDGNYSVSIVSDRGNKPKSLSEKLGTTPVLKYFDEAKSIESAMLNIPNKSTQEEKAEAAKFLTEKFNKVILAVSGENIIFAELKPEFAAKTGGEYYLNLGGFTSSLKKTDCPK